MGCCSNMPVQRLYDAFFVLIESDEWDTWTEFEVENDLQQLALAAIPWFKFPRTSLSRGDFGFDEDLNNAEI